MVLTELLWLAATNQFFRPTLVFGCGVFFCVLGGLWADHALGVLGEYPFLVVLRLAVSPLRRGTFSRRRKSTQKGFALTFGPLAGARGSFAPESIRAQRLRFASLHLLPLCLAAPDGRCAPTPGSIPPLSLPTGSRIKSYSSLRSLLSGAASPRAAALLLLFCGSEPAREGGLTADLVVTEFTRSKL